MKKNITRRASLQTIAGAGLAWVLPVNLQAKVRLPEKQVTMGLVADLHIGFIDGAELRLDTFLGEMKRSQVDALVQLGDFAYPNAKHQPVVDKLNAAHRQTLHVIGNHELDHGLTCEDAVKSWGIPHRYYSRVVAGIKVIVLDGNDRGAPDYAKHGGYHKYIAPEQRKWLKQELASAQQPVLIFSHQPLAGHGAIDHADEIQAILSAHQDKILLAVNGHTHIDDYLEVDGVHYVHINSASYYWLGGKPRLLTYKEPLFASLEIDPQAGEVRIVGRTTTWNGESPEQVGYYQNGKHDGLQKKVQPRIGSRKIRI